MCVLKAHYNPSSSAYKGFSEIDESSGYVYLAQEGESGNAVFSVQSVKSMIRTDKGE